MAFTDLDHLSIPFERIIEATENFTTIIGKGGYGPVYKGQISLSGERELTTVAVKRLDTKISGQGLKEFLTEIQLLSRYKHPNLVSLVGFCNQGPEKALIYEYALRGSLDKYLRNSHNPTNCTLTWKQRLNICIDAARGLDHLHNHVAKHERVIHRDVKSANVLLDNNWKAMIADFGLSKIGRANEKDSFLITNACGTHGYCDPAYQVTGILTKESDVYSFGVVLFEVLCGRLCFFKDAEGKQRLLPQLAQNYYKKNKLNRIIDPTLSDYMDTNSMKKFSRIAYQCLLDDREGRPSMDMVLHELEKALHLLVGEHEKMGMNVSPIKEVVPEEPKVTTLDLLKSMDANDPQNDKSRGQVVGDLLNIPKATEGTPVGGGELVVIVYEAQYVTGKHHTNPYVRIIFRGEEKRTKHIMKNRDPRWDEEFMFILEKPPLNDMLYILVDSDSSRIRLLHHTESLGYIAIDVGDVVHNKRINEKYHLIDSISGKIHIELQWRTVSDKDVAKPS